MRRSEYPLVTVITPSFNQGKFIEDAILSVKNQSYPNIEHIIIDGGSTDNTIEILKKYKNAYNMRWISEPDNGQADAINKGFALADGDIIGWINSDDCYFDIDAVNSAAKYLNGHPDYDVVYGDAIHIDESNHLLYISKSRNFDDSLILKINFLIQPSVLFRKSAISNHMLKTSLNCSMDYDLWVRLSKDHKFKYLKRIIGVDRIQSQRKTITKSDVMLNESLSISNSYHKTTFWDRLYDYPKYKMRFIFKLLILKEIYHDYKFAFPLKLDNVLESLKICFL